MAKLEKQQKNKEQSSSAGQKPRKITTTEMFDPTIRKNVVIGNVRVRKNNTLVYNASLFTLFFENFLRVLYFVGVMVIRKLKQYYRHTVVRLYKLRGSLAKAFYHIYRFVGRVLRGLRRRVLQPFREIRSIRQKQQVTLVKATNKVEKKAARKVIRVETLRFLWLVTRTILNYVVPVLAVIFLYITIVKTVAIPIGLNVIYKDQIIGQIANEKQFAEVIYNIEGRMGDTDSQAFELEVPLYQQIKITPEMIDKRILSERASGNKREFGPNVVPTVNEVEAFLQKHSDYTEELVEQLRLRSYFTSTDVMADRIIAASNTEIVKAYGLYANGELVGAVENGDIILDEIEKIQANSSTGKPGERVEFTKPISFKEGVYPRDAVVSEQDLIDILYSKESADETYTVQMGDTPSSIAQKTGISRQTLSELNPNFEEEFVAGQELYISRSGPFLSVKNIYIDTYIEEIPYRVVERENIIYAKGYRQVERPGVPGQGMVTAEITIVDGVEIDRLVLNTEHISDPIEELVTIGSKDPTQITATNQAGNVTSTGFRWPAQGGFVGTVLGGYPGHTGVDINNSAGPVIASASGVVTTATYSYVGYGNHVRINHGNGYETLYAHNSALYVSVGDYVAQGQIIAQLGSTGNSTGPHIHFEVIYNGQIQDPMIYIGSAG